VKAPLAIALCAASAAAHAQGDGPMPHAGAPLTCTAPAWPQWSRYLAAFVSPDGRVIDRTAGDRSTSEGQAYALFFSLVAGDRASFDRVLRWTRDNLADGDLTRNLPSWHWGKRRDGTWGVIDANSASDADVWMAYALLEAGRLWSERGYLDLAERMLANVSSREIAALGGLGPMLLPGPHGFVLDRGRAFRLNPSYEPPQVLRRLAAAGAPGPWAEVLASSERMLRASAPNGAAPDWILYRPRGGFLPDPVHGGKGSYDAIRVYLWIGMDPQAGELAQAPSALLRLLHQQGRIPEQIDVASLRGRGEAPVGFYAALLPLARARGDAAAAQAIERRVSSSERNGLYGDPPAYYDQNLILFGKGFADGRYRFGNDGRLMTEWESRCVGSAR
jgi:endoglucanase